MSTKQFPHKNNFSTGEVSERFEGRTDVGKYYSALKRAINFLPFTQGGITRRPGLRFARNNFCDLNGRIIPFKFSRDVDSNFLIHLCDEQLFITNENGVEVQIGAALNLLCEEVVDDGIFVDPLANTCALMDCLTSPHLNFRATGGVPPYSWGIVNPGTDPILTITGTNNENVEVTPPVNVPSVSGSAFQKAVCGTGSGHSSGTDHAAGRISAFYNCGDDFTTADQTTSVSGLARTNFYKNATNDCPANHTGHLTPSGNPDCTGFTLCVLFRPSSESEETTVRNFGALNDIRTAQMITDGCEPCTLAIDSAVLTLTDNVGTMISIPVEAIVQ